MSNENEKRDTKRTGDQPCDGEAAEEAPMLKTGAVFVCQEQSKAGGYIVPDSFTHGTSAQRSEWFRRGVLSGDMGDCDTFSAYGL